MAAAITKAANKSVTKILMDLDIRNHVQTETVSSTKKPDGQCNKCFMYPIPDHQPVLMEDETFPRSTLGGSCWQARYELGADEQWTPLLRQH